jgi:hypothetical protein
VSEAGEIYKVPIGLKLQCSECTKALESTEEKEVLCWIDHEDSSTITCLSCVSKRQREGAVGPKEFKPKRTHRRETDWMEFERD